MNYSLGNMLGGAVVLNRLDPDANAYIAAVEAADGQALEPAIRNAYDVFVRGCKSDGIWNAIKASCILAGARTLSGALVPLKGSAPTNNNFVSGDYVRATGLKGGGTGSGKVIDSNRANNADGQDNNHNVVWVHTAEGSGSAGFYLDSGGAIAGDNTIARSSNSSNLVSRNRGPLVAITHAGLGASVGLIGASRSTSASYDFRASNGTSTISHVSDTPTSGNVFIFGRSTIIGVTDARISYYSIGESLNLTALDARLATLTSSITAALP